MKLINITTAGVALLVALGSTAAFADKLDDFKEAAQNQGCKAIPYRSERDECESRQRAKNDACRNFSCDRSDFDKQNDKLREKRQSLKEARDRKNDEAIPNLERAVKDLEDYLNVSKSDASRRVQVGEGCVAARESVQKIFSSVKSAVKSENDQALQAYIPQLVKTYEDGEESHRKPIDEVKQAIENCKAVINTNLN